MAYICSLTDMKGKVRIELDNGLKYVLKKKDLPDAPLHENDEVDEKEFHHFVLIHQYPDALNTAVAMLARRACSRKEIADKLASRGFCDEVTALVLYKLEKERLLNDQDFSDQWTRYRSGSHYGPNRIYRELRMKGIDEDTAREALSSIDKNDTSQKALDLALKTCRKSSPGEDPRKIRQRVLRSLVSRGFDWDTAREACDKAMGEHE